MKDKLNILEKIKVINEIIDTATDSDGKMSYIGFEIGKVIFVTVGYFGDKYNVYNSETGSFVAIDTYENIVQSGLWETVLKNQDALELIKIAEKRYSEEFAYSSSFEARLIEAIESIAENTLEKEDLTKLVELIGNIKK